MESAWLLKVPDQTETGDVKNGLTCASDSSIFPPMTARASVRRNVLRPLQLTAVVFFALSGGPYGLEPLLSYTGDRVALLLVLITPLVWCIPTIFMVLELNSMMPKNGGYYQWVKNALGIRWGFLEGWWSWLYAFVDSSIYPVLFVEYLSFLVPAIVPYKYELCLAFIWIGAMLNLLGVVPVGDTSILFGICVFVPFLILFAIALLASHASPAFFTLRHNSSLNLGGLGMGIYTVMWNFLGWDNATPFVEEVERPLRSYLISMTLALAAIIAVYVLTVVAAAKTGMDVETLQAEGFPAFGLFIAGKWLGMTLALGGLASAMGLFLAILLSISRVPKAMADDGIFPEIISRVNRRFNTPHVSIILCALIVSGMVLWGFDDLLIIDVTLYCCGLMLEFVSWIALRRKKPDAERPFRVPGGTRGIIAVACLPISCMIIALAALLVTGTTHTHAAWFAVGAILSGPVAWLLVQRRRARLPVRTQ